MRLTTLLYQEQTNLSELLQAHEIEDGPGLLVQIFTGITERSYIDKLLKRMDLLIPRATLCGTTTGGEIAHGCTLEQTTILSFCEFEHTTLESTVIASDGIDGLELGQRLAAAMDLRNARLLLSFATGPGTNGDDFVRGVGEVAPHVPLAGGLTGDILQSHDAFVFTRDRVLNRGAVGVALYGSDLHVSAHYALDWIPVGKDLEITQAQGNRVHRIDGVPAIEVYERYLGNEIGSRIANLGLQFPLIVERRGRLIARKCVNSKPDGSLIFAGTLHEGERARFGLGDPNTVVKSLRDNHHELADQQTEGIFIYSSIARKVLMKDTANLNAHYLESIAPTVGCFTHGEFFHLPDGNEFLNHTITRIALSESVRLSQHSGRPQQDLVAAECGGPLWALSNLVGTTNNEIERFNATLEHLVTRDALTGIYSHRKLQELIQNEIIRCQRYRKNSAVILFNVDDFKKINDSFGIDIGDGVLKSLSKSVIELVRNTDVFGRWGGDEFLILSSDTTELEARTLAERIRSRIEESCDEGSPRVTVSLGITAIRSDDTIDLLMERTEQALYSAKQAGKNGIFLEPATSLTLVTGNAKGTLQ